MYYVFHTFTRLKYETPTISSWLKTKILRKESIVHCLFSNSEHLVTVSFYQTGFPLIYTRTSPFRLWSLGCRGTRRLFLPRSHRILSVHLIPMRTYGLRRFLFGKTTPVNTKKTCSDYDSTNENSWGDVSEPVYDCIFVIKRVYTLTCIDRLDPLWLLRFDP